MQTLRAEFQTVDFVLTSLSKFAAILSTREVFVKENAIIQAKIPALDVGDRLKAMVGSFVVGTNVVWKYNAFRVPH